MSDSTGPLSTENLDDGGDGPRTRVDFDFTSPTDTDPIKFDYETIDPPDALKRLSEHHGLVYMVECDDADFPNEMVVMTVSLKTLKAMGTEPPHKMAHQVGCTIEVFITSEVQG